MKETAARMYAYDVIEYNNNIVGKAPVKGFMTAEEAAGYVAGCMGLEAAEVLEQLLNTAFYLARNDYRVMKIYENAPPEE